MRNLVRSLIRPRTLTASFVQHPTRATRFSSKAAEEKTPPKRIAVLNDGIAARNMYEAIEAMKTDPEDEVEMDVMSPIADCFQSLLSRSMATYQKVNLFNFEELEQALSAWAERYPGWLLFVHPFFGYIAENKRLPALIEALRKKYKNLAFVGPNEVAMENCGGKTEARELAIQQGVPVIPGYQGRAKNEKEVWEIAKKIGPKIMIKNPYGRGGWGIRKFDLDKEGKEALLQAVDNVYATENATSIVMEAELEEPEHIEIQVCFDKEGFIIIARGNPRNCSLQTRKFQKFSEIIPGPLSDEEKLNPLAMKKYEIDQAVAAILEEAASKFAQGAFKLGYEGVGTIEFLVQYLPFIMKNKPPYSLEDLVEHSSNKKIFVFKQGDHYVLSCPSGSPDSSDSSYIEIPIPSVYTAELNKFKHNEKIDLPDLQIILRHLCMKNKGMLIRYYHLEMNVRLQIEQALSALVGLGEKSLVALQMWIAAGGSIKDFLMTLLMKRGKHQPDLNLTRQQMADQLAKISPYQSALQLRFNIRDIPPGSRYLFLQNFPESPYIIPAYHAGDCIPADSNPVCALFVAPGRNRVDALEKAKKSLDETKLTVCTNMSSSRELYYYFNNSSGDTSRYIGKRPDIIPLPSNEKQLRDALRFFGNPLAQYHTGVGHAIEQGQFNFGS